jgi:hypothetical protein
MAKQSCSTLRGMGSYPSRHKKGRLRYLLCSTSRPQTRYRVATSANARPCNLNQTSRPEHATSVNLLSVEFNTPVSTDDTLLQLAIWASAGLQAITNVFRKDSTAAEAFSPAFMMSMREAECKIAHMKLESLETNPFLRVNLFSSL